MRDVDMVAAAVCGDEASCPLFPAPLASLLLVHWSLSLAFCMDGPGRGRSSMEGQSKGRMCLTNSDRMCAVERLRLRLRERERKVRPRGRKKAEGYHRQKSGGPRGKDEANKRKHVVCGFFDVFLR